MRLLADPELLDSGLEVGAPHALRPTGRHQIGRGALRRDRVVRQGPLLGVFRPGHTWRESRRDAARTSSEWCSNPSILAVRPVTTPRNASGAPGHGCA